MTQKRARKLNQRIRSDRTWRRLVLIANERLAWLVAVLYGVGLVMEIRGGVRRRWLLLLILPLCAFVLTTVLRALIKKPRPYQVYAIRPLVMKESASYAFPSRHMTSAFAIATSLLALSHPVLGIACIVLGLLVGIARVLGGIHDIPDILGGTVIGILAGVLVHILI